MIQEQSGIEREMRKQRQRAHNAENEQPLNVELNRFWRRSHANTQWLASWEKEFENR